MFLYFWRTLHRGNPHYDYPDSIILDLSPYPKGIYLLTITTKDKVFTEKVILQ